jgi:hypothetical protein
VKVGHVEHKRACARVRALGSLARSLYSPLVSPHRPHPPSLTRRALTRTHTRREKEARAHRTHREYDCLLVACLRAAVRARPGIVALCVSRSLRAFAPAKASEPREPLSPPIFISEPFSLRVREHARPCEFVSRKRALRRAARVGKSFFKALRHYGFRGYLSPSARRLSQGYYSGSVDYHSLRRPPLAQSSGPELCPRDLPPRSAPAICPRNLPPSSRELSANGPGNRRATDSTPIPMILPASRGYYCLSPYDTCNYNAPRIKLANYRRKGSCRARPFLLLG